MTQVLIVDDDDDIRATVRYVLEDAGYQVAEACDGLAALDLINRASGRMVILLDMMMPRLDGAGVLGVVAGDRHLARRHAFVLTTADPKTLTLAFANLLVNLSVPILHKPFDVSELLGVIEHASARLQ